MEIMTATKLGPLPAHNQLCKIMVVKSGLLGSDMLQIEAGNSNSVKRIYYHYFCTVLKI